MSNITKNKNKDTIYQINKIDSLVTFEGNNYNIGDHITAKNLIYMLIDKCIDSDNLIDDYKTLLKNKEESHNECRKTNVKLRDKNKQLERDIKQSDNNLGDCLDNLNATEKEKNKIEDSIKIFFRLNEKIIK
jgi:septal ring factor EnvC (AmiA/AmiB activator)